jgi:hypothetical protein
MATIKVTFEKKTPKFTEGVRIECPGVNLSLTTAQAEGLARAIMVKIGKAAWLSD